VENYPLRVFGALWAQNKDPDLYRFWNAWEIVKQGFETIFTMFFGKLLLETQLSCKDFSGTRPCVQLIID